MEAQREGRRKDILPVSVLLGHKVKNLMTVIEKSRNFGWGAIGF